MARIAGIDIPQEKRGVIALTSIYGIGKSTSSKILQVIGIDEDRKAKTWSEEECNQLRKKVDEYEVEGELRGKIRLNIQRLTHIRCYRGYRHQNHLPMKQRTKTNARTRKGPRKTVANKKKATK